MNHRDIRAEIDLKIEVFSQHHVELQPYPSTYSHEGLQYHSMQCGFEFVAIWGYEGRMPGPPATRSMPREDA